LRLFAIGSRACDRRNQPIDFRSPPATEAVTQLSY